MLGPKPSKDKNQKFDLLFEDHPQPMWIFDAENQIILSWTNSAFTLQSAPSITGVFTNVPSATSAWTNVTSSSQQFFRLSNP